MRCIIGDVNDAIAVVTGYDIIWGERISREERALYAAGLLFGSGSLYRKGLGMGFDAGIMEYRAAQKITRGKITLLKRITSWAGGSTGSGAGQARSEPRLPKY